MRKQILNNKQKWSLTILMLLALILPLSCETIFNEATITGEVVNGETSQPLKDAFVRAIGFSESVMTDSEGSYLLLLSIEDPEVDAVTLEISKTGFLADTLQNIGLDLGGTVNAPPSNLIPIATTSGQVIISGYARNGITGDPIESAFITVFDHGSATALSDSSGNYVLKFIVDSNDSNSVTVQISKSTFLADTVSNIGISFIDTIRIRDANLLPISIDSGVVALSGKVVNGLTGVPLEGALIGAPKHSETTFSDSLGDYVLSINLDAGESKVLNLLISKATFASDTLSNIGVTVGDTVDVRPANLLPLTIAEGVGVISGSVFNGITETPIEGAFVRALDHSESVLTDSNGKFSFAVAIDSDESNVVTLEIKKVGFLPSTLSNLELSIGDTVKAPPVNLLPIDPDGLAGISGSVFNGITEAPIEGAFVRALNHFESALTDSAGKFTFTVDIDGDESKIVNLEIKKEGFFAATLFNLELSIGDTVVVPPANLLPIDPEGSKAIVKGVTVDNVFFEPIEGVQVRAIGHNETTLSNELGNFSLAIVIKIDESNVVDLIFSQDEFVTDTLFDVTLTVDSTITLANQELTPANRAGPPANATIFNVTRTSISIKGAGGEDESSELTYRLQDVNGITLDRYRPTDVTFTFFGPGGGEFLSPFVATTDADGLVRTALNSGEKAGVVQVIATFDPGTGPISSSPTPIAIHGGAPDSAHFTLSSTLNIAGLVSIREATVTVYVGDKFSNIARPGTAVQFQSKYGIIEGSGVTDENGRASVSLWSANPLPLTGDKGFVPMTAETKDENGNSIFAIDTMLWSGHTLVEMVAFPGTFAIPDGGDTTFTVRVSDIEFGNPLEGGSTVDFSATIGSISGSAIIPDTQSKGNTTTLFDFTLRDNKPGEDPPAPPEPTTVTILVTSPNGNVKLQISGTID